MGTNNGVETGAGPQQERVEMVRMVMNHLMSRTQLLLGRSNVRRSIEAECDHPAIITNEMYREMYYRFDIANRIVHIFPRDCFQVQPEVYEEPDQDEETEFERAIKDVSARLRDPNSLYEDNTASQLWSIVQRADELSGICQYGVMLLGLRDGRPLSEPARFYTQDTPAKRVGLLYIHTFPEYLATIKEFDRDPGSDRFGLPLYYNLKYSDDTIYETGGTGPKEDVIVHWSRVIHLADDPKTFTVYGTPRMEAVYNRLLDIRKLYGGSAEMYWQGALPGLSFESDPALGEVSVNLQEMKDAVEAYFNGLQRFILSKHMAAKSLAPQVVDPSKQIEVQITAICIKLGIPKRIFMGSERGELASSQDDAAWNDRIRHRQQYYLTPMVIAPLIDRLISVGVLPRPNRFIVAWPDLKAQTEQEKANVAVSKTQALAQYVGSGSIRLIHELDYLSRILGFSVQDVMAMLDRRKSEPVDPSLLPTNPEKGAIAQTPQQLPNQPGERKVTIGTT